MNKMYRIFVGVGEDRSGNAIEYPSALISSICADVAQRFGGYTAYIGKGGWTDPSTSDLVEEACLVLDVATTPSRLVELRALCVDLCRIAEQTEVLLVYPNGDVEAIPS